MFILGSFGYSSILRTALMIFLQYILQRQASSYDHQNVRYLNYFILITSEMLHNTALKKSASKLDHFLSIKIKCLRK